uniref:Uncharacterized protein n=1 Tax=Solanum tuberosum TaxID=4113 RepID=M1AVZ6_SOLTU
MTSVQAKWMIFPVLILDLTRIIVIWFFSMYQQSTIGKAFLMVGVSSQLLLIREKTELKIY